MWVESIFIYTSIYLLIFSFISINENIYLSLGIILFILYAIN
jgi:hypothetical protein